jgi:hypothetical protein
MVNVLAGAADDCCSTQFNFSNAKSLTIGSVAGTNGITGSDGDGQPQINVTVTSGSLTVDQPVTANDGGSITLSAASAVNINSNVMAVASEGPISITGGSIVVGNGATISAAATFGNPSVSLTSTSGGIDVQSGATITASTTSTFSGNASVSLNATGGDITIGAATVSAVGANVVSGLAGTASVTMTSDGGIALNGATVTASGGNSNDTLNGAGSADILLQAGGTIDLTGGAVAAAGGAGNMDDGGNGALSITGASITVASGQTISATGGTSPFTDGTASMTLNATAGDATLDGTLSSVTPGQTALLKVIASNDIVLGSTGSLTAGGVGAAIPSVELTAANNAQLNGNITSTSGVDNASNYVTVIATNGAVTNSGTGVITAHGATTANVALTAKTGIGTDVQPIRLADDRIVLTATNAAGGGSGDIAIRQLTGDVSSSQLTLSNGTVNGGFYITAATGDINVQNAASISNPNGFVLLGAANTVSTLGTVQAGGNVTLIANDMDLQGPVIANSGAGDIAIQTTTAGRTIDLGSLTPPLGSTLALSGAEIGQLDAANVIFGLAANPTQISTGAITTTGAQTYNGAVALLTNTVLTSTGGGSITFNSTVQSPAIARTLTVNASGTTTFNGLVGGSGNPLAALTTDAPGSTAINSTAITTSGAQSYGD